MRPPSRAVVDVADIVGGIGGDDRERHDPPIRTVSVRSRVAPELVDTGERPAASSLARWIKYGRLRGYLDLRDRQEVELRRR
jgi:hypothetical protein